MQHPGPILTRPTGCRLRVGWLGMGPEGREKEKTAATALSATASALAATTTTATRLGAVPPIPLLLRRRAPPAPVAALDRTAGYGAKLRRHGRTQRRLHRLRPAAGRCPLPSPPLQQCTPVPRPQRCRPS